MLIRIHSFVNENSLPYFRYMVANYLRMASRQADLEFIAYAFSPAIHDTLRAEPDVANVVEVYKLHRFFVRQTWRDFARVALARIGIYRPMGGSNGHAAGLNAAFANSARGVIDVIADTDTVILQPDWDVLTTDLLRQYGIVGTSYEDIGGFSSGTGTVQTYKNLPSLTWIALSPDYDFSTFNADPDKRANIIIDSQELADLYNLPLGYELVRDVGWKLPGFLKQNGIPHAVFNHVKPSSDAAKAVRSGVDYHEEYQWQDTPFLAHQRGSHQHAFRQGELSSSFYEACERYLAEIAP